MIRKWKFYVTLCIEHAKADQIFYLFHSEILIKPKIGWIERLSNYFVGLQVQSNRCLKPSLKTISTVHFFCTKYEISETIRQ